MSQPAVQPARTALALALRDASQARLGVSPAIEPLTRAYARSLRDDGVAVERAVVEIKAMVRSETGGDEAVYLGKVVGWAIAGYYAGTARPPTQRDE